MGKSVESERVPRYLVNKPKFYCPLSPNIMWNHGLKYSSCPLAERERDMRECDSCINKGKSTAKSKSSKRKSRNKKKKENIPKIEKTYISK